MSSALCEREFLYKSKKRSTGCKWQNALKIWKVFVGLNCFISNISIHVLCSFCYFVLWPTNAQIFHKLSHCYITWYFSDRASWIGYILITILMHWLLFIHKTLFSSKRFEPQVLIFRRIQLYTCSIWYCHTLWDFLVACQYTAWVRTALIQSKTAQVYFNTKYYRYKCVTYSGLYLSHPPTCQHKNLKMEAIWRV